MIKLLTPSHTLYTDTFNDWLESIPQRVKDLVLIIKRRYRPDWGLDWEKLFSVDSVNGQPANELRFDGDKLITRLLRVGFDEKGSWRLFALRKDFIPASKILAEDDITASTVAPIRLLNEIGPGTFKESAKFVHNCEYRLFQRPDDAIHRGFDKQTEKDLARPENFISNFECLSVEDAKDQVRQTSPLKNIPIQCGILFSRSPSRKIPITFSFPPPTLVWWTASPPRIHAICKPVLICTIPAPYTWRPWGLGSEENRLPINRFSIPSDPSCPVAETTQRTLTRVFAPFAASLRSTIWSSLSFSSISLSPSPANHHPLQERDRKEP